MVKQDKVSEGIGLSDAPPDKMIAKILLYPVLSVLIWSLFNSQNLLIGGFYEGWGSRFQLWINFSYKFQIQLATICNYQFFQNFVIRITYMRPGWRFRH